MTFFDREELARALANTYKGGRQVKPWDRVEDYRRYLDYTADYPNKGSGAVASALELPRGRVRAWMNGSKPDPVRAIEIAEENDWFDLTWDSEVFAGLNILIAWVFSGGSITTENYVPQVAVTNKTRGCAEQALRTIGVEDIIVNREDNANRATEIKPKRHAAVLGRYLTVLGAPVGEKNQTRSLSLPPYLEEAPWDVRRDFMCAYVWNRGTIRRDLDESPVQIREERSSDYRAAIFELLNSLVPDAVQSRSSTFRLSKPATELLYQPPEFCKNRA